MAQKRMFSKQIVHTDDFLDMPHSTKNLYFYLNLEADDDGFVDSVKKVMRMINSSDDDYKILLAKRFILELEGKICVIKHWLIHNYIASDRYHPTKYVDQKKILSIKENKSYTEKGDGEEIKQIEATTDEYPVWLNRDIWGDWEEYRKNKGKKLTKQTIKLQLKFLEAHKEDHKEIIETSIFQGWTGLFELKGKGRTVKQNHDL